MNRDLDLNQKKNVASDSMSKVRELCKLMGIRQKDLAANLGLKPSQMNLYVQGKVEMRADRFVEILKLLDIDLEAQLNAKIAAHGGGVGSVTHPHESRILASLGRLQADKKESLLRIISILGDE